jgi:hypothetical protein
VIRRLLKKLYNSFVRWYYRKEIREMKFLICISDIKLSRYYLSELEEKIHPKTDVMIELDKSLKELEFLRKCKIEKRKKI